MRVYPTIVRMIHSPGTVGELETSVLRSPYAIHGWRPISVKIQPIALAMNAAGMPAHNASIRSHFCRVSEPRMWNHTASPPIKIMRNPSPTMIRNDQ